MIVVAADEGWREQSTEHLAAARRARHPARPAGGHPRRPRRSRAALSDSRGAGWRTARLADVEAVAVSGATGAGLDDLRAALDRLVDRPAGAGRAGRVRLWVDRSFTIRGAGTVVTGTLGVGTLSRG